MADPFPRGIRKRRATSSIILGIICLLGGALALAFALFPEPLHATFSTGSDDAIALAQHVAPEVWLGLGGALLAGLGMFLALRPRGYRALLKRPRMAPTVVYYDFENQAISAVVADEFLRFVRDQLAGQHAELFFFADISNTIDQGLREIYTILRRNGFRQRDVAHVMHGDTTKNVKNMVDMAIILEALERGMLAPSPQHFIFITADLMYIPLYFRLRQLGHEVSVWARAIPELYQRVGPPAGIEMVSLDNRFSRNSRPFPYDSQPFPRSSRPLPQDDAEP